MPVAAQVQQTVQQDVRIVRAKGLPLGARLASYDRVAQHHVALFPAVGKREHVCGVVLSPEAAVEPASLACADDPYGGLQRHQRGPLAQLRGAWHAAPRAPVLDANTYTI